MIGALAGDIIGSVFEFDDRKPGYNFELFSGKSEFTDDSVLTVALADSIINGGSYTQKLKEYFHLYPGRGYGGGFRQWADSSSMLPYNSWGNGSAMRVSPVGWIYNTLDEVLLKARQSAEVTHNHPEGIKGAQAAAASIFLARKGNSKKEIQNYIQNTFRYDLKLNLDDLIRNYSFNESCQDTVPQAIFTFLISEDYEDSIRKAVIIGGDSDTLACINGAIAEAYYNGVPENIEREVRSRLDPRLITIIEQFYRLIENCKA
jgi:ADP-ribosylglycohydrolase